MAHLNRKIGIPSFDMTGKTAIITGGTQGLGFGMACALAVREGKLILSLSGNPVSSLTTYYGVVVPVLRKMAGLTDCVPEEITVTLADDFKKRSPVTRFLRGKLRIRGGEAFIELSGDQGNVVLSSAVGCDVMAIVPGGSGSISAGTKLKGFLL